MTAPPPNVPPVLRQPDFSTRRFWIKSHYAAKGAMACLVSFLTCMAVTFSVPTLYTSRVRLQIDPPPKSGGSNQPAALQADPSGLLQTHAQALRSNPVLLQVVKEERLVKKWSAQESESMTAEQCVDLLKRRTETRLVLGTHLIELVEYSTDPHEAAQIANRFAKVYGDSVRARTQGETIRIAEEAVPATKPSLPNIPVILTIGFLGAALLGAMITSLLILRDWAGRKLRGTSFSRDDAQDITRLKRAARKAWIGVAAMAVLTVTILILISYARSSVPVERKPEMDHSTAPRAGSHPAELASDSKDISALTERARVLLKKGDLDGAMAEFNRFLALDPNNAEVYVFRAIVKEKQGDTAGAADDFDRAIALCPRTGGGYVFRGLIKFKKGDVDGAISDYDQAARLAPAQSPQLAEQYAEIYTFRGNARYGEGNFNGAIADFSRVIENNPKNVSAFLARSWAYLKKQDYARARADAEKCKELGGTVDKDLVAALSNTSSGKE